MTVLTNPIPVVETPRLRLRGVSETDLTPFANFFADPEAARFVGGAKARWETWRALASVIGHWHLRGFGLWVVELKHNGAIAGWCGGWAPESWPENEIGYTIFPAYQRQGLATEAVIATLEYVYKQLGWQTAVSYIKPANLPSQGVARKCGAQRDGEATILGDHLVDVWRHQPPGKLLENSA